jgi:uncharacterized protein YndB with AHSA1/START domain
MTDSSNSAAGRVRIERLIPASIKDVFAAWTDPKTMSQWLSPTSQAEVEADVRVSGSFRLVMLGDGMRIDHEGEYVAIEPPRLISFTWRSAYTRDITTLVTVTLEPVEQATRLVLVHERLPDETAESHRDGWGSILDRLIATLPPDRRRRRHERKVSGAQDRDD